MVKLQIAGTRNFRDEVKIEILRITLALFAILLIVPAASAHDGMTFEFNMENNSVQPEEAEVRLNDSVIFYNLVTDSNRTITFSNEGANRTIDWQCSAGPSDSTTNSDECKIWFDPSLYKATIIEIQIYQNDSLWNIFNLTLLEDSHDENGPPDGGFNLPGNNQQPTGSSDELGLENIFLITAIVSFSAAGYIWISRNFFGESSNMMSKQDGEE